MLFKRKKQKFKVFKIYVLDGDQKSINRPCLVHATLELFESKLALPENFDIGGPYGIRKGRGCGIRGFRNKLRDKGHEKYYAISGVTENCLGFEFMFDAVYNEHRYTELIIWFHSNEFELPFEMLIHNLTPFSKISYAYGMELDEGWSIRSETKIKKGLLGGLTVKSSFEHLKWIEGFDDGDYRDLFKANLMSSSQLVKALKMSSNLSVKQIGDMHLVEHGG